MIFLHTDRMTEIPFITAVTSHLRRSQKAWSNNIAMIIICMASLKMSVIKFIVVVIVVY